MRTLLLLRLIPLTALLAACWASRAAERVADIRHTVASLVEDENELKGIPFADVVYAATGRRIIPFDAKDAVDRELLVKISGALDRVLTKMNTPDSAAQKERRINEVSAHFEKAIKEELNMIPGCSCEWPKTAAGKVQRSGYPDLRLLDKTSGRVVYLDPKLYEQGSRNSSLRTFYFEPKKTTNKILDDAHHFIVGIEHDGKKDGVWRFLRWELVDLAKFNVRLKAEFQGSNRDLYRPEAIVGRSGK